MNTPAQRVSRWRKARMEAEIIRPAHVSCTAIHSATPMVPLWVRSEEHTSELQSRPHLVCRLLLERYAANRDLHSFPTRRSSDLKPMPTAELTANAVQ